MKNIPYLFASALLMWALPVFTQPAAGILPETFLLYKSFPSKYIAPRTVEVWLPDKYEELEALPVLYMFGGAACFSTHWPPLDGVFLEYIKTNLPDPATHKIYFDFGTEGLDAEYEPFQQIADEAMQARGFKKNKNWVTMKFEGAKHYEEDWHARFHIPMEFLLR